MATYKQKPIRAQAQHFASDSEETSTSEQEWVVFGSRTKKSTQPQKVAANTSEDDDWNVLSDNPSPIEEKTSILESVSDGYNGSSAFTSDGEFTQDENTHVENGIMTREKSSDLTRLMPSHDGTGNFFNSTQHYTTPADSSVELTSPKIPNSQRKDVTKKIKQSSNLNDEIPQSIRVLKEPITSTYGIHDADGISPIYLYSESTDNYARKHSDGSLASAHQQDSYSSISKDSSNNFITPTTNIRDISPTQTSSNRNVSQGRRVLLSKYSHGSSSLPTLVENGQKQKNSVDDSSMTQLRNNSKFSQDPMSIEFPPTISQHEQSELTDNSSDILTQSSKQTQPPNDGKTLFSAVWTSFRRFTSTIMNADAELSNDFSQSTAIPRAASNHQNFSGLASIIAGTGENNYTYDGCYLPFGNHLTLSELGCFTRGEYDIWSSQRHSTLKHQNSLSLSSSTRGKTCPRSSTTAKILTPASSSTNLKSFAGRAGSDCGLESGRREIVCLMNTHSAWEQECI